MQKLLIVEDEKSLAKAYQTILEKHGYQVRLAFDGEEALAVIESEEFDLILLDITMPKMNGLQMLARLDDENIRSRVIVFSNQDAQTDIDEAFRLGAKRYLLKAWASPQELVRIVEEALDE